MNRTDLELFKQTLKDGLDLRIRSVIASCTEEINCSKKHTAAMAAIVSGSKIPLFRSSAKTKIAAIIIAATMLLAGCAIIYKEEIRGFIEHIYEEYIEITFTDGKTESSPIEEVYELTYLPEGYVLEESTVFGNNVYYTFFKNTNKITFYQTDFNGIHIFDNESGYSLILTVNNTEIYYKKTKINNNYVWDNGKYAMQITSTEELSTDELLKIIEGIKIK